MVEAHIEPHRSADESPNSTEKPGNLTVTGTATLDVTPDTADVRLDLLASANTPRRAVAKLRQREQQMRKNLEGEGIESDALAVSTIRLSPKQRWDAQRERQILVGYEATLCVTATTKDFAQIPAIIEGAADAGVTTVSTAFRSTRLTELKREVRQMALDAAKAKADQFKDSLALDLSRVMSVAESQAGAAWSTYGRGLDNVTANVSAFVPGAPTRVQAETLPLTLTVTVGYALG